MAKTSSVLIAAVAASLLGGCNMVISEQPWFAAEASGPQLRQGLWVNLDPKGCTFDAAKPIEEWPECAEPMIVRGADYVLRDEEAEGGPKWQTVPHVLAQGTPLVDQIEWYDKDKTGTKAKTIYLYFGLTATAQGSDGAITAVKRWLVQCGPIDPPGTEKAEPGPPQMVTARPFAGLTVEGSNCKAANADALRGAARDSEAIASDDGNSPVMGHWVRDGSR